ncbi:MAG: hypothetical protein RJB39_750 [Candidatus Parcubacteria bacterium]|jgi:ABC-2 type transport system permease protein
MFSSLRKQIKQAAVIIRFAWVRQLNFRFSIAAYRVGEILEILVLIAMWTSIYASSGGGMAIKGFTLPEMITYVLIGNLCMMLTRNYLPSLVSRDITEGKLSMALVRPISYMKYVFLNEFGRVAITTIMAVVSQIIIISFFLDKIVINGDPAYLLVVIVMLLLAFITELIMGFIIGTLAFWTDEIEGPLTAIDRIKRFFAGGYFPLSLLPIGVATFASYLPFAYSFFVPAQLYLKKMTIQEGLMGLVVQVGWITILSLVLKIVWSRGLKKYEASGS